MPKIYYEVSKLHGMPDEHELNRKIILLFLRWQISSLTSNYGEQKTFVWIGDKLLLPRYYFKCMQEERG